MDFARAPHESAAPPRAEDKSSKKFLRIARRFFPATVTFRRYIDELNNHIIKTSTQGDDVETIQLHPGQNCSPASFNRLIDRLYVAWPSQKEFTHNASDALKSSGAVSMDQLLQDVINATLRRHRSDFSAVNSNVLCNGFSVASNHGYGSVFRNLDARSSSTPVQLFRSPLWKQILSCLGHVILRHLLITNILLLSISEVPFDNVSADQVNPSAQLSSVFLQLCGPLPRECAKTKSYKLPTSDSDILLKRDLLYITPTHRRLSPSIINKEHKESSTGDSPPALGNGSLPKGHHLQGMKSDKHSAKKLLSVIFQNSCHDGAMSRSKQMSTPLVTKDNGLNSRRKTAKQHLALDYDQRAKNLSSASRKSCRGKEWLKSRKSSYRRLAGLVPVLEKVIARTHKFSFRRILGRTCPLPKSFDHTKHPSSFSCEQLIRMSSNPKLVARFVIACTRQMLPTDVFGSSRNRDIFEKGVHNLLRRRLKRENFSISQFAGQSGIAIKDITWLHLPKANGAKVCNPTDLKFRKSRVCDLFAWLFRGVVLPVIQQSFYVTDGDLHRNRVFFFRREVWVCLVDSAHINVLRSNKRFKVLSKEDLARFTSRREKTLAVLGKKICPYPVLVYHQLRFVPKRSSLRGIQRMRGKMLHGFLNSKTRDSIVSRKASGGGFRNVGMARFCTRKIFRHILRVLVMEGVVDRSKLGASVFSLNDIYGRFLALKAKWNEQNRPQMHVCSVDISTSFDTIPLGTLFSDVVPSLLSKERYAIFRYIVSKPNPLTGRIHDRFYIHACKVPGEEASFTRVVREQLCRQHTGAIFIDQVQATTLTRDQIMLALQEFIGRNIVAIPRRNRHGSETGFAVQCQGLPQGNELSPLLTSLFYAHVENEDLSEFLAPSVANAFQRGQQAQGENNANDELSLLMRQVDDSIFLTSSLEKAQRFAKRTERGWISAHGFSVNSGKTKCNFPCAVQSRQMQTLPWCGLIIDPESLEVRADYSRYGQQDGGCLRDALYVEQDFRSGYFFAERAWTCFKPKLHPLLLDANINSRATVALNIYQAALLVCLKLSSYAVVILPRDVHLTNVIDGVLSKFVGLVLRSVSSRCAQNHSCRFSLSQSEVTYLTIHAFQCGISKKLKKRRKMKKRVISCLQMVNKRLREAEGRLRNHQLSIVQLAKRISQTSCGALWDLRL